MIFGTILRLLSACGRNARILLPLGVVIALLMPSNGAFFKPATPFILAILVGCAFVRLDIGAALKAALRPQRLIPQFCDLSWFTLGVTNSSFHHRKVVRYA